MRLMGMQDNWLVNFKAVVTAEIERAGGKESIGYRAVETRTGIGYDYIYQIYKDKPAHKPKRPSADAVNSINRAYGNADGKDWASQPFSGIPCFSVTKSERSNVESGPDTRTRLYPVISDVQAGVWTEICDSFSPAEVDMRQSSHDLGACGFMLRVKGISMMDPNGKYTFPPGFLVHVKPEKDPTPGQFVVVRRAGENAATFKKYVELDGVPYLEAINPEWPERYIKLKDGDVFCGIVKSGSFDTP